MGIIDRGTIDRIDGLLKERGITGAKMSQDLKFSSGLYSQWKKGEQRPSLEKLEKMADYFSVSIGYLLYGATFLLYGDGKIDLPLTPAAHQIGRAYEKATPPVQRTVEVALEPYMDDEAHP